MPVKVPRRLIYCHVTPTNKLSAYKFKLTKAELTYTA